MLVFFFNLRGRDLVPVLNALRGALGEMQLRKQRARGGGRAAGQAGTALDTVHSLLPARGAQHGGLLPCASPRDSDPPSGEASRVRAEPRRSCEPLTRRGSGGTGAKRRGTGFGILRERVGRRASPFPRPVCSRPADPPAPVGDRPSARPHSPIPTGIPNLSVPPVPSCPLSWIKESFPTRQNSPTGACSAPLLARAEPISVPHPHGIFFSFPSRASAPPGPSEQLRALRRG